MMDGRVQHEERTETLLAQSAGHLLAGVRRKMMSDGSVQDEEERHFAKAHKQMIVQCMATNTETSKDSSGWCLHAGSMTMRLA